MIDEWFMDDRPSEAFPIYTRGNAGEVFPDPISPIAADFTWLGPGDEAMRDWLDGYTIDLEELDPWQKVLFEAYGGHVYMNLSIARLMGARTPGMTAEAMDQAYFGSDSNLPPHVATPRDSDPAVLARCGEKMGWFMTQTEIPVVDEQRAEVDALVAARPDLGAMSEPDLVARMREMKPWFRRFFYVHSMVSSGAGMTFGALTQLAMGFGSTGLDVQATGGLGGVDSAAPSWALWDLSRLVAASPALTATFDAGVGELEARLEGLGADAAGFLTGFRDFQARFGSRGPNEWEPRSETWGTEASLALALIDRMRNSPDVANPQGRHEAAAALAGPATERFRALVSVDAEAAATFGMAFPAAKAFLPARERSKANIVKVIHEVRLAARELGRRLAADGRLVQWRHIFMVRDVELDAVLSGSLAAEAARRDAHLEQLATLEAPFVFIGQPPPVSEWPRKDAAVAVPLPAGTTITGIPGSSGVATGRARIVLDPADPEGLEPGEILVCPITDPSWTPLFVPAAGVVCDTGGTVSHAVIVSRELGIPCVASAVGATTGIPNGATITVDGRAGTVTIVSV